ncbi:hypothetical protein HPB47_014861, partial [Ixodes persulcatus]
VVKPRRTFELRSIESQIGEAMLGPVATELHQDYKIRRLAAQDIFIICTNDDEDAARLEKIRTLHLPGLESEVEAYPTRPAEMCRGILHGIRQGLDNATIRSLTRAGDTEVLKARRLEKSQTAQPRGYSCETCEKAGAQEDHECVPFCALCGSPHSTYATECKQKFYRPDSPKMTQKRRNEGAGAGEDDNDIDVKQKEKQIAELSPGKRQSKFEEWKDASVKTGKGSGQHNQMAFPIEQAIPSPQKPLGDVYFKLIQEMRTEVAQLKEQIQQMQQQMQMFQTEMQTLESKSNKRFERLEMRNSQNLNLDGQEEVH